MEMAILKYHVLDFIKKNQAKPIPTKIYPGLKNITQITENFKNNLANQTILKELCQYCLTFKNYMLAEALINFLIEIDSNNKDYYFFKATILFLKKDINASLEKLEKYLNFICSSDLLTRDIMSELEKGEITNYYMFFLPNILQRYKLPIPTSEFNLYLFPYSMHGANQTIQQRYAIYLGYYCDRLQEHFRDLLKGLLNEEYELNGDTTWYHLNAGKLQWLLHNRPLADYHFQKSKELAPETSVYFDNEDSGVYSWLTEKRYQNFEQANKHDDPFHLEKWQWSYADLKGQQADLLFILGCDSRYLKYLPKFLFTLVKAHKRIDFQSKIVLALALENPSSQQKEFLKEISEFIHNTIPNMHITYGYGSSLYRDAAYFTCLRFLFAEKLYQRYPTKTFILDIDLTVTEDFFSKKFPLFGNYDFGLRLFAFDKNGDQLVGAPWCLGAGITYLNHSEITPKILHFIGHYIKWAYDPHNFTNWCIDQCALSQAVEQFIRPSWKNLVIRDIDQENLFDLSNYFKSKNDFYYQSPYISENNFKEQIQLLLH